jgi:alkylhydroperoxidase/carboxymuconolactone decarboxylase family protein YurZ
MELVSETRAQTLDPVFAEMNAATDRQAWSAPELTTREKVLLCLVADVCQQTLGLPFELHVTMGLEHGLSADDLRELLRFISYDSGYPAALAALDRLTDIEREQGLPGPTGHTHHVNADGSGSPIPAPVRGALRGLDSPFADYVDLQSRMRADMKLLSVRERAFATITVDVLYQTLDESFRVHATRALSAGATPDDLRAVLRFTAQFGMTKAWRGLRALNALLAEEFTGSVFA